MTDPRIGTELAGYRIETLIGRGGMSVVYLAEDIHLKRKVALKLLAPELGQSEKFRERFVRESQLAASLDHPSIIPIFGAGEAEGILYIAMRYVEGTDLKTLIEREGPLSPERTLRLVSQAASALDTAHQRGLIHRDVKPANMLIASGGGGGQEHLYLSDFGLTKRSSSDSGITGTGQFVGTLDYAAPEQFEGKPLDARTDVYSLGCVLYECLTGEPPFQRDNEAALVYAHLMAAPPGVTDKSPDLPAGIDEVVGKAMAKSPDQRYESAGSLVDAARGVLPADRPTEVLQQAPGGGARPSRVPHRVLLIVGGALVVLAAVVVGSILGGGSKGTPGQPPRSSAAGLAALDRVARISQAGSQQASLAKTVPIRAGSDPRAVALGEGSVWVANRGDDTISRIDPVTNRTVVIDVGNEPVALGLGEGGVWVVNRLSRSVSRIDPGTNRVVASVDLNAFGLPSTIAVGEGAVWVGVDSDFPFGAHVATLHKIDPRSNRTVAMIPFEGALLWVVVTTGDGAVWAAGNAGNLVRIDPRTNQDRTIAQLEIRPGALTMGDGSLWIASVTGGVLRVDPASGAVEGTVPGGGSPGGLQAAGGLDDQLSMTFDNGVVWVTGKVGGTIDRILASGNNALEPIRVGQTPTAVAVGFGSLWVTVDTT
jgi:streptogramin lyase/tRNA A-37 threonylcarbamoyl transferase component Bud32